MTQNDKPHESSQQEVGDALEEGKGPAEKSAQETTLVAEMIQSVQEVIEELRQKRRKNPVWVWKPDVIGSDWDSTVTTFRLIKRVYEQVTRRIGHGGNLR